MNTKEFLEFFVLVGGIVTGVVGYVEQMPWALYAGVGLVLVAIGSQIVTRLRLIRAHKANRAREISMQRGDDRFLHDQVEQQGVGHLPAQRQALKPVAQKPGPRRVNDEFYGRRRS